MTATPSPIRIFEPEGRAIPYVDEGQGPALVLIPGARLNVTYLGTLASVLVEEDFRVARIGSRRPVAGAAVTMHDLAQDVIDVMDHIALPDAWIGGHAFGTAVARTVALDHHDRVNGVLMLAADGPEPATAEAAQALETVFSDAADADILAAIPALAGEGADAQATWNILRQARDLEAAHVQLAAQSATPDAEWAVLEQSTPVLIIQGDDDRVTPPANGEALQAGAPHLVTTTLVPGGGHLFPATHPGETAAIIEDYLDWD
ncbi:alpha/beta hydrolase [Microbacterium sp. W1N]|uniref:alpha/beta fold hydrolase n=1 Tax=Microbacterium festucae TaxID=2977531 RepID=UPI0021C0BEEE|nr:alpha/beta hydrolase [Microbacterium festucae]MCT9819512.1 alpha/beta hydrolase [Microbacterium festucae]